MQLPLFQYWLATPEEEYHEGHARFFGGEKFLVLHAELVQPGPPASKATFHGQRLWELGDVVELFLQRQGDSGYHEYQVAPNGKTLSLFYPDLASVAAVRAGSRAMEEFLVGGIPDCEIAIGEEGWSVRMTIPLKASRSEMFRVSCCRYEAREGLPAVISSTSPHPIRDFHRPQDWREFIPVAG